MTILQKQLDIIIKNNNLEELKEFFCDPYRINKYINSALVYASYNSSLEIVKYLVEEKGANDLDSALYNASGNNNLEMVEYLVEAGATDLNTVLDYASRNNNLEIVKYLIEKGATHLNGALNYASDANNLKITKCLKYHIFIRQNNLCPEKYKRILFLY
jgi:ankyrin repeat protein